MLSSERKKITRLPMYSKVTIVIARQVAMGIDLAGFLASSPATAIPVIEIKY